MCISIRPFSISIEILSSQTHRVYDSAMVSGELTGQYHHVIDVEYLIGQALLLRALP